MNVNKNGFYIAMWVLLVLQMLAYSHYKLRGKDVMYIVTKVAGGVIFTGTALVSALLSKPDGYSWLIIAAMFLSVLGDYYLAQPPGKHRLKLGAVSFVCAHCFFMAGFITLTGIHWQTVTAFVLVYGALVAGGYAIKLNCRGAGKGVALYIAFVTFMACCACSLPLFADMPQGAAVMTAVGGALFLISDVFWVMYGLDKNAPNRLFKIANVFTYFPAQLLIAGALLFR